MHCAELAMLVLHAFKLQIKISWLLQLLKLRGMCSRSLVFEKSIMVCCGLGILERCFKIMVYDQKVDEFVGRD